MITYLFGDELLQIRETLAEKIKELGLETVRFDLGENNLNIGEFSKAFLSGGLFGEKLIVIANPSKVKDGKEIAQILKKNSSQKVIFYDLQTPKLREVLVKYLKQNAETVSFPKLKYFQKKTFIKDRLKKYGGQANEEQIGKILLLSDSNLEIADQIIQKLALYYLGKSNWRIEDEVFEGLVGKDIFGGIFDLIESVAFGDRVKSLAILEKLLAMKESEFYIQVMIVSQFRKIISAKSMLKRGMPMAKVSAELSIPFFNQSKFLTLAKKFSFEDLRAVYKELLKFEEDVKSGKGDPATNLELLVMAIT